MTALLTPPTEQGRTAGDRLADTVSRLLADGPAAPGLDGERLPMRAASVLAAALEGDGDFGRLADVVEELDDDLWHASRRHAIEAGLTAAPAQAVACLLAQRNTFGATCSPLAISCLLAVDRATPPDPRRRAAWAKGERILADHADGLRSFLGAQRRLTASLVGADAVQLWRGELRDRTPTEHDTAPRLRPLSSWSTSRDAAISLARHGPDAGKADAGGYLWLWSADVPAARILSTAATGFGAPAEHEVVVQGADPRDGAAATCDAPGGG